MAELIQRELQKFDRPENTEIFFSAHGVPVSYVEQVRPASPPLVSPQSTACLIIASASRLTPWPISQHSTALPPSPPTEQSWLHS